MIVEPKRRGFICTTAHPMGCHKNVEDMVTAATEHPIRGEAGLKTPKNALVLGCSSGYGLAARAAAAFSMGAATVGVSFEREPTGNHTASPGFYNNRAFDELAAARGLPTRTLNADAFSDATKEDVIAACKELFSGGIDLVVYSLAAPRRTDPATGQVYHSVLKPIGQTYTGKTVDFASGVVSAVTIEPATEEEIAGTVHVMGGEDWVLWVNALATAGLLAKDFITLAFTYIGPPLTYAIYRDGTIGRAKDDLLRRCDDIRRAFGDGHPFISVNKALVTQASSAIPVVPLYISLLYKIMKEKGTHEDCIMQMLRLFRDRLYAGRNDFADQEHRIFLDDYEMAPDVQAAVTALWPTITTENVEAQTDIAGYRDEFFALFGFGRKDVDYTQDVNIL